MKTKPSKNNYCEHREYCGLAALTCTNGPKEPCQMRQTSIAKMPLTTLVKQAVIRQKNHHWFN